MPISHIDSWGSRSPLGGKSLTLFACLPSFFYHMSTTCHAPDFGFAFVLPARRDRPSLLFSHSFFWNRQMPTSRASSGYRSSWGCSRRCGRRSPCWGCSLQVPGAEITPLPPSPTPSSPTPTSPTPTSPTPTYPVPTSPTPTSPILPPPSYLPHILLQVRRDGRRALLPRPATLASHRLP